MKNNISFDITKIPKEWSIIPSGVFFEEKSIKNTNGEINLSVYRDYGVIIRDSRDDNHNRVSEDISNYKLVEPGDFVLNKMKCWMGSLGVSNYRGIVSPSYTVLKPTKKIHNNYFQYLLRSELYRQIYESLSYGVRIGQWELRYRDFKKIPSLYPPIEEQKIISQYLDKNLGRIDSLIVKVKDKINLLNEKSNSLINLCVTKGLTHKVEMKNSGISWIGKIPKHWSINRLKNIATIQNGYAFPSAELLTNSDIPVIRISNVKSPIEFNSCLMVSKKYLKKCEDFIIKEKDILVGLTGGTIGKSSLYEENKTAFLNQRVCALRFSKHISQSFLHSFVLSNLFSYQIKINCKGDDQPNIGTEELRDFYITIPPKDEQILISNYLNENLIYFNKLIEIEKKRMSLLMNHRQTLISETVIGKKRITKNML